MKLRHILYALFGLGAGYGLSRYAVRPSPRRDWETRKQRIDRVTRPFLKRAARDYRSADGTELGDAA